MGGLVIKGPNGSDAVTLQQSTNVTKVVEASDIASDDFVKSRIGSAGVLGFRNKIVDGRFDFWYEGTTQTTSGYGSDTMWLNNHSGSTKTHTAQPLVLGVDLPSIDVPTAKNFSRTVVSSVAGAANFVTKVQKVENVSTCAGKIVTISFYAKADAAKSLGVSMVQDFGSGGSSGVYIAGKLVSLSSGWTRYSLQFQLPSMSEKTIGTGSSLQIFFWFDGGSTVTGTYNISSMIQQSGTFDIACIQLEEGSVATQFEELPIEVSQQRVNRYFLYNVLHMYSVNVSNSAGFNIATFPTRMRVTPTYMVVSSVTPTMVGITADWSNSSYGATTGTFYSYISYDARL